MLLDHAFSSRNICRKILKKPVIIKIGRGGEKYFDINAVKMKKIIGNFFQDTFKKY